MVMYKSKEKILEGNEILSKNEVIRLVTFIYYVVT